MEQQYNFGTMKTVTCVFVLTLSYLMVDAQKRDPLPQLDSSTKCNLNCYGWYVNEFSKQEKSRPNPFDPSISDKEYDRATKTIDKNEESLYEDYEECVNYCKNNSDAQANNTNNKQTDEFKERIAADAKANISRATVGAQIYAAERDQRSSELKEKDTQGEYIEKLDQNRQPATKPMSNTYAQALLQKRAKKEEIPDMPKVSSSSMPTIENNEKEKRQEELPKLVEDTDRKLKDKIKRLEDDLANFKCPIYEKGDAAICARRRDALKDDINFFKKKLEDKHTWAEKGNEIIKANRAQYTESFSNNVPWGKIDSTMRNPQRLITVQNQLIALNGGNMPKYEGEWGKNEYYFKDEKTGAMFFVDKDGSYMESVKYKTYGVVEAIEKSDAKLSGLGGTVSAKLDGTLNGGIGTGQLTDNKEAGIQADKTKIDLSIEDKFYKKDFLNAVAKDAEDKKLKNWEYIGGEIKTKSVYSLETSKMNILEDGTALKFSTTYEALKGNLKGTIGTQGVEVAAGVDFGSGKVNLSYVQSPTIELEKGNLQISQREIGVSVGAGLGVGGKANFSTHGVKAEGSAVVKAGFGWENYEANKNINYLPDNLINKVVSDYYSK